MKRILTGRLPKYQQLFKKSTDLATHAGRFGRLCRRPHKSHALQKSTPAGAHVRICDWYVPHPSEFFNLFINSRPFTKNERMTYRASVDLCPSKIHRSGDGSFVDFSEYAEWTSTQLFRIKTY